MTAAAVWVTAVAVGAVIFAVAVASAHGGPRG